MLGPILPSFHTTTRTRFARMHSAVINRARESLSNYSPVRRKLHSVVCATIWCDMSYKHSAPRRHQFALALVCQRASNGAWYLLIFRRGSGTAITAPRVAHAAVSVHCSMDQSVLVSVQFGGVVSAHGAFYCCSI